MDLARFIARCVGFENAIVCVRDERGTLREFAIDDEPYHPESFKVVRVGKNERPSVQTFRKGRPLESDTRCMTQRYEK
jgi:hypothetical protein